MTRPDKSSKSEQQVLLTSEADTQALAEQLAAANIHGSVWLSGDLGAGKTTLTRYWLRALGHQGSVKSPTYTLVEPYQLQHSAQGHVEQGMVKRVYHADLYRLQDPEELSFIGFEEYLDDEQALVIIEWASRADGYLPQPMMTINITVEQVDGQPVRRVVIDCDDNTHFELKPLH
ncbi:tRNA (adenosine(37)-N6)-threonylcarbamoyltransferase complex ATPase subunit type 1 TsaE [Psychrobacter sp. FDAARGOS_221]|uniref:tRNA (adenosine(37)-N6)-threonylcarbamoyltransferase complex ATPase subunit type 1 TsaE n=1 Tax=Psychrobacter sp. FDAARGOS_221 TaxID=1975705 RepID=UPI000BB5980C|nr:tRNA (adenosine(37)-N6)-threonylcarbamoyltransferase complex ATPase subunit type 1 TsaE [Psychrobacter sp. FDAARGOS_221]PNK61585.1 tRNA (adenosine(37)-N6)-threonylcarbamoyltransferase complex ATPase subunit type 1 TsaE [Psychrobacter sp. FDAARGOS_221]